MTQVVSSRGGSSIGMIPTIFIGPPSTETATPIVLYLSLHLNVQTNSYEDKDEVKDNYEMASQMKYLMPP